LSKKLSWLIFFIFIVVFVEAVFFCEQENENRLSLKLIMILSFLIFYYVLVYAWLSKLYYWLFILF